MLFFKKIQKKAEKDNALGIILELDTPGGQVDIALKYIEHGLAVTIERTYDLLMVHTFFDDFCKGGDGVHQFKIRVLVDCTEDGADEQRGKKPQGHGAHGIDKITGKPFLQSFHI